MAMTPTYLKIITKLKYLAVAALIILTSINLVVFNADFYEDNGNCRENCKSIIKYFLFLGDLDGDYSSEERVHMNDVRILISIEIVLCIGLLGLLFFCTNRDFIYGGAAAVGIVAVFFLLVMFGFNWSFIIFHELLFWNDYWLLPSSSLLISYFSEGFFYKAAVRIILYTCFLSTLFIIIGKKWSTR